MPGAIWFPTQVLPQPRRLPSAAAPHRPVPRAAAGPVSPQGCAAAMRPLPATAAPHRPIPRQRRQRPPARSGTPSGSRGERCRGGGCAAPVAPLSAAKPGRGGAKAGGGMALLGREPRGAGGPAGSGAASQAAAGTRDGWRRPGRSESDRLLCRAQLGPVKGFAGQTHPSKRPLPRCCCVESSGGGRWR